jgi:membrane associated rhomboid family serine protease
MLILPLEKDIDWRRPPAVTFALVAINLLVFLYTHGRDEAQVEAAVDYYLNSGLPAIEFPLYAQHLRDIGEPRRAEQVERLQQRKDAEAGKRILAALLAERELKARITAGELMPADDPRRQAWAAERARFEQLLDAAPGRHYGFVPAEPRAHAALTHMFLHAGWLHLIGNMLFLVLVGIAVETALGRPAFLALYLLGGLLAIGLHSLVYGDSQAAVIGASGAVAALMGAYTALFGSRRIRFFYWVFVYFDYVRAPAIALLPVWVLYELAMGLWSGDRGTAYFAHVGGLLAGAAMGYAATRLLPTLDSAYLDRTDTLDRIGQAYKAGLRAMSALEPERARQHFQRVLTLAPNHPQACRQLYRLAKLRPREAAYRESVYRIFRLPGEDPATLSLIAETLRDYVHTAKDDAYVLPALASVTADRLIAGGWPDEAEWLLAPDLQHPSARPELAPRLLALAHAFRRARQQDKFEDYLRLLTSQFPATEQAAKAGELLDILERAVHGG